MFVLITSTYPPHKLPEVTEVRRKGLERTDRPDFVKELHVLMKADLDGGARSYSIVEIDAGKEYEGLVELAVTMSRYNSIEGYRHSMDVVWDAVTQADEIAAAMAARQPG